MNTINTNTNTNTNDTTKLTSMWEVPIKHYIKLGDPQWDMEAVELHFGITTSNPQEDLTTLYNENWFTEVLLAAVDDSYVGNHNVTYCFGFTDEPTHTDKGVPTWHQRVAIWGKGDEPDFDGGDVVFGTIDAAYVSYEFGSIEGEPI